jgi:hypothetical protein
MPSYSTNQPSTYQPTSAPQLYGQPVNPYAVQVPYHYNLIYVIF